MRTTLRTIGVIGTTTALLLSVSVAFAREQATSTPRLENKGELRGFTASSTGQQMMENAREEAKQRMEVVREEAKTRMETQREEVKQRMAEMKDKVKQQKAEKLATQFENMNKTWTDHFMNLLDRYTAIVQKMQARADIAAGKGKNVTAANAAILSAKTAIATAQAAVIAQAAKTYTPTVSTTTPATSGDEEVVKELRSSFQTLHSTLFTDLFALRDGAMKNARTAVQSALQTLSSVKGVDDDTATTTANQ